MVGPGLKLRYVFAVLTVGALLTTGVAMVTHYSETAEREELRAVDEQLDAIAATGPRASPPRTSGCSVVVDDAYDERTVNIVGRRHPADADGGPGRPAAHGRASTVRSSR